MLSLLLKEELSNDERAEEIKLLIESLPRENVLLLERVFGLCHKVAENAHVNRMTTSNIAALMGPNILYPSVEQNTPEAMLKDINAANSIVEIVLLFYQRIFEKVILEREDSLKKQKINDEEEEKASALEGPHTNKSQEEESKEESSVNAFNHQITPETDGHCTHQQLSNESNTMPCVDQTSTLSTKEHLLLKPSTLIPRELAEELRKATLVNTTTTTLQQLLLVTPKSFVKVWVRL